MPASASLSRRRFLQAASAAGLLAALPGRAAVTSASGPKPAGRKAHNVIFMVADGMSAGAFTLGSRHLERTTGRPSRWADLLASDRELHCGLMDTASADSLVTDSAAGSSAWGGGRRVKNGYLNIAPDGTAVEPLLVKARRAGKSTGLVTTATVTHATPAGFLATIDQRGHEAEIAVQYLARGIDVCLGGGGRFFAPTLRPDHRNLAGEFAAAGYTVLRDRAALLAATPAQHRLLGLFGDDHLPYRVDHRAAPELDSLVPTLAEMAAAALARLALNPAGFVLQVEGARVDMAAHNNDAAALLGEMLDFDAAVGVVLDFQREHPDTLVVLTTDHGTANPALNGDGDPAAALARIDGVRESFDRMAPSLRPGMSAEELQERFAAATGLPITAAEMEPVREYLGKLNPSDYAPGKTMKASLGAVLTRHLGIGWTGTAHTGDFVIFTAKGPGAEAFPALVRNDAVHGHLLAAMAIA